MRAISLHGMSGSGAGFASTGHDCIAGCRDVRESVARFAPPLRASRIAPPLRTKSVESKLFELLEHTIEPCENRVMPDLLTAIADLESACTAMVSDDSDISLLTDDSLMHAQRRLAMGRRHVEASEARVAGEVARRSRRELGYEGLAQRLGARTPEALV